ncbi:MAG: hypothetical protein JNM98_18550 [Rhodocyclaceae bacterium]|nr:hypothetical protein [Rhodocyclaceae bacterium]
MREIRFGAPSVTGGCALLLAAFLAASTFPIRVKVKNHMPRNVSFPEVDGLFLRHTADADGCEKIVTIADADQLQRLAASIEQVAELNGAGEKAVTITDTADEQEAADEQGGESPGANPSDGLTYEQLKSALTQRGILFPGNAKKAELAALLDSAPAEDGTGANT